MPETINLNDATLQAQIILAVKARDAAQEDDATTALAYATAFALVRGTLTSFDGGSPFK